MSRNRSADADGADGYLLLRKRPGISSFAALSQVKKAFGTGRVGHSGTLDSFAEGLLVVLVGRSTRLVPWFTGCDKRYIGLIQFGSQTDTLDPEGAVVAEALAPSRAALEQALSAFHGAIMQAPPLYSSVPVDGKRAHELARAGVEVEMKSRPVTIKALELLSYEDDRAKIDVRCTKGTYIRSLARDIALAAGSRAHLRELLRLEVAGFKVEDAADPAASDDPLGALRAALRPVDAAAFSAIGVPVVAVPDSAVPSIAHGKPLDPSLVARGIGSAPAAALVTENGKFLAVAVRESERFAYGYVSVRPEDL